MLAMRTLPFHKHATLDDVSLFPVCTRLRRQTRWTLSSQCVRATRTFIMVSLPFCHVHRKWHGKQGSFISSSCCILQLCEARLEHNFLFFCSLVGVITDGISGHRGAKIDGAIRHLNSIFLFRTDMLDARIVSFSSANALASPGSTTERIFRPQEMATSECPTEGVNNTHSGTAHVPRTRPIYFFYLALRRTV